jgi:Tol biopolymer transport system component
LYYVQPGTVPELFSVNLGARDPSGLMSPERVVRIGPGTLDYDISPTDGTVAYSTGRGLWTQDAAGGIRYLAPPTRGAETGLSRRDQQGDVAGMLRARHATWHPQGHTIAFVDDAYGKGARGPRTGQAVFTYTPGVDTVLAEPLFGLDASDEAWALSWSADGQYLAVHTRRGSHVVRVAAKEVRRSFFLENRDVHWSPDPAYRSLLVTERRAPGGDAPFGVADLDGSHYRVLGKAAFVTWQPNGKGILFARHGRGDDSGTGLWRHNIASKEPEKVSDVPAMGRGVREVVFSPDGRYLVFTMARGAWVVNISDGDAVELPGVSGRVHSLRWRGDPARYVPQRGTLRESGTILYTRSIDRGEPSERRALMLLDPVKGVAKELRAGVGLRYAVSPFHTSVLIAAEGGLEVLDLEAGTFTRLERPPEDVSIGALAWHPSGLEVVSVESENGGRGTFAPRLVRVDLRTHQRSVMRTPQRIRPPDSIAYSPSGRHLLLSVGGEWSLLELKSGRISVLPAAPEYVWRPGLDGLLRTGRRSAVVDLHGQVVSPLPSGYAALRWVNKNTVLTTGSAGRLARYDVRTRRSLDTGSVVSRYGAPPLSPSGTYMVQTTATSLWVQELQTGKREWIASGGSADEDLTWIPLEFHPGTVPKGPPPVMESDAGAPALFFKDLEADPKGPQSAFSPLWMVVRGGVPKWLAEVSGWDVSPGGGEIVYIDRYGLWLLDVGTREERLVLPFEDGVTDPDTRLADPEWSPDGTLITFVVVPRDYGYRYFRHLPLGVYLVDPVTAKLQGRALVYSRNPNVIVATEWSAASDTVLAAGVARAVEYHVASRRTRRTLQFGQTSEPKGSTLANDPSVLYLANRHGRVGRLMRWRGGRAQELSEGAHAHVWSPAGDAVYFFEDGDLVRSSKDGTYRWRVRATLPGGRDARSPLWTRDGRLTYVSDKTVWIVDPATGSVRRLLRWHNPLLEAAWGRSGVAR